MPVRGGVCPTLFGVLCSYVFLFALKGALQELKLYGTPSLAEVQCDNHFQVSTILTLCYIEQTVTSRYSSLPYRYCEIQTNHQQDATISQVYYPDVYLQLNPLKPELNPICYLLALLGAHYFLHVSRIRVKLLTFRRLMSYICGAPILDVSRSHTTTQHSR